MTLTDQHVDFLDDWIRESGMTMPSLAEDFLDHMCTAIEFEMECGADFDRAFESVKQQTAPNGLKEFQVQTHFLLTYKKQMTMKKIIFFLGFISIFAFLVGYTFKMMHWPTANILLMSGSTIFALGFLPMYYGNKYLTEKRAGLNPPLWSMLLNAGIFMFFALSITYKFLKWPGSNQMFVISMALMACVLVPRLFYNWYKSSLPEKVNIEQ